MKFTIVVEVKMREKVAIRRRPVTTTEKRGHVFMVVANTWRRIIRLSR